MKTQAHINQKAVQRTGLDMVDVGAISVSTDPADLAQMMGLLTKIYSDPYYSSVREIIANAADIHSRMDIDATIIFQRPSAFNNWMVRVRDFGGIPPEEIPSTFFTYGKSTKNQEHDQIGGFGIGSKSPFAFCSSYTLKLYWFGRLHVFNVSMTDNRITKFEAETNEENGIEVSFDVPAGMLNWNKIEHWLSRSNLNVEVREDIDDPDSVININPQPIVESGSNWTLFKAEGWGTHSCYISVGGMLYELNNNFDNLISGIVLEVSQAEMFNNRINILPNREGIEAGSDAIKFVRDRMDIVLSEILDKYTTKYDNMSAPAKFWKLMAETNQMDYKIRNPVQSKLERDLILWEKTNNVPKSAMIYRVRFDDNDGTIVDRAVARKSGNQHRLIVEGQEPDIILVEDCHPYRINDTLSYICEMEGIDSNRRNVWRIPTATYNAMNAPEYPAYYWSDVKDSMPKPVRVKRAKGKGSYQLRELTLPNSRYNLRWDDFWGAPSDDEIDPNNETCLYVSRNKPDGFNDDKSTFYDFIKFYESKVGKKVWAVSKSCPHKVSYSDMLKEIIETFDFDVDHSTLDNMPIGERLYLLVKTTDNLLNDDCVVSLSNYAKRNPEYLPANHPLMMLEHFHVNQYYEYDHEVESFQSNFMPRSHKMEIAPRYHEDIPQEKRDLLLTGLPDFVNIYPMLQGFNMSYSYRFSSFLDNKGGLILAYIAEQDAIQGRDWDKFWSDFGLDDIK